MAIRRKAADWLCVAWHSHDFESIKLTFSTAFDNPLQVFRVQLCHIGQAIWLVRCQIGNSIGTVPYDAENHENKRFALQTILMNCYRIEVSFMPFRNRLHVAKIAEQRRHNRKARATYCLVYSCDAEKSRSDTKRQREKSSKTIR